MQSSFTYDVYLSFRDEDTRRGFTGHLYKSLQQNGIRTFIDLQKLYTGSQIDPSLVKAIDESKIAIVIFSESYASSPFCLDELCIILDRVKGNGRFVLPIFYKVDRYEALSGFGFDDNNDNIPKVKVQNWRLALQKAANLFSWSFTDRDGYEYEFIQKIVDYVSRRIDPASPLNVADYLVGLDSRVTELNRLLLDDSGSGDVVHVVGICGMGGVGKTTLARAVYNSIADRFEGACFLDDVRRNSVKRGLVRLQGTLLSEIVGDKDIAFESVSQGISTLKERLCRKNVLLVIDDVDKDEQLHAVVGGPDWFGPGSRVIITTRDMHLLASHGVERTYRVEKLNEKEALELLSWKAFKFDIIDPSLTDKLNRAITYASGLPLALEVIGSYLFGKEMEEWESALDQYERIPDKDIHNILKVSFDALDEHEQSVFLNIACRFEGYRLLEVEDILCVHYGDDVEYRIRVLVDKCLVKIEENGCVTVHHLIEDMAREIIRLESLKNPGSGSRLLFQKVM